MTQEQVNGFGFGEALQAVANIVTSLAKPTSNSREKRRNIRHAKRSMKFLKKELQKDGWQIWERELWEDTIKNFQTKIKEL